MALEHALLVALREQPAAGLELTRRFQRSIGYFWSASHQQIYRVLARMESDGWVRATTESQHGRPDKKVYAVTTAGAEELAGWLAGPLRTDPVRSDLAVRMRGASFGDRAAVLGSVREALADHRTRLEHYRHLAERDFPSPEQLTGMELDHYLVLQGGIRLEEFWTGWLADYLHAHDQSSQTPEKDQA